MSFRRATSLRISVLNSLLQHGIGELNVPLASFAAPVHQHLPSLRSFISNAAFTRSSFSSSAYLSQSALPTDVEGGDDQTALPDVYVRLDRPALTEHYRVQPRKVFAVVEVGGTQYKVTPDDLITTEKLEGVDINDTLRLQRVLMLGSTGETVIGRPYVPGGAVVAAVEEQFLDGKVISFYKRRRKNSRRTRGHRQPLTSLRILEVEGIEEAEAEQQNSAVAADSMKTQAEATAP